MQNINEPPELIKDMIQTEGQNKEGNNIVSDTSNIKPSLKLNNSIITDGNLFKGSKNKILWLGVFLLIVSIIIVLFRVFYF